MQLVSVGSTGGVDDVFTAPTGPSATTYHTYYVTANICKRLSIIYSLSLSLVYTLYRCSCTSWCSRQVRKFNEGLDLLM